MEKNRAIYPCICTLSQKFQKKKLILKFSKILCFQKFQNITKNIYDYITKGLLHEYW